MYKILISIFFTCIPSFTLAAGWCTTSQCFVSRYTALTSECIVQCNDQTGATIQLGEEELNLSCSTLGTNHPYCPGYTEQTTQTAPPVVIASGVDENRYIVTSVTNGTVTTSEVNVQSPYSRPTYSSDALLQIADQINTTFSAPLLTQNYIREVPFEKILSAKDPAIAEVIDGEAQSSVCEDMFTINLRQGADEEAVQKVQVFLNKDVATKVSDDGAGSPGNETTYFGPKMLDAVKRFQTKYFAEILTTVSLQTPSGYWGPSTRTKANAIACTFE